ncbi:hypothetical protein ACN6LF_001373 [[Kitasatospora] papulosa]|uniref:hypothetical protein n=1 Tax=[Kitasatospora] papulosa TaxID=1464011 RepID=UPI00403CFB8E
MPAIETASDDQARTSRLLTHLQTSHLARVEAQQEVLEELYNDAPPAAPVPLDTFERVVLEGAMPLPGETYPPAGHTYPTRG